MASPSWKWWVLRMSRTLQGTEASQLSRCLDTIFCSFLFLREKLCYFSTRWDSLWWIAPQSNRQRSRGYSTRTSSKSGQWQTSAHVQCWKAQSVAFDLIFFTTSWKSVQRSVKTKMRWPIYVWWFDTPVILKLAEMRSSISQQVVDDALVWIADIAGAFVVGSVRSC